MMVRGFTRSAPRAGRMLAELGLPNAVADDDPLVEREVQQSGETRRYGGYGQDRRLAIQRDGRGRDAGRGDPFELIGSVLEREIVGVGKRACFLAENRNDAIDRGQGRGGAGESYDEAVDRYVAADTEGDGEQQRGGEGWGSYEFSLRIAEGREQGYVGCTPGAAGK